MEKVLKKYTTIPQHLYVNRSADIQLKRIIEEMQRPGYVLVARQMGKTNLLFNAKRTLENENRLFAYVDLSNLYNSERECYRNIIDCIIEPNRNIFESVEDEIEKIRLKNLPPHNEYHRCLIIILNYFKGDLVIILDEIDALKSVDYSDNIFAQIRSNYFSRTSYPVLERLTYTLSGVLEPTELIKDRNKSPFNIGDKIYLDDFTKEEHDSFIEKSKLQISTSISEEIYDWTNGNPRLTFDICAEVENYLISYGVINSEILNSIIEKKYLNSFDIAPIDHIRELAKSNKDIRKAILNIHKKNSSDINDEIKKKLYLYGIINSKFNEETTIKNKIIKLSLSEEWVKSIDKENSFVYGLTKYSEKEYNIAIEVFLDVLENTKSTIEIEGCHYFIGISYMKLNKYDKAIEHFSFDFKDIGYMNDSIAFIGVSKMALGDVGGLTILEEAIKTETNTHAYQNALLNLAVNTNDNDKALQLLDKLYDSTFISDNTNKDEVNQLRTLSLYYQSEILEKRRDNDAALDKNNKALESSSFSDSLYLIFNQYHLQEIKDESLKNKLVDVIIENNLKLDNNDSYPISFNEKHIYYYLNFIFDKTDLNLFNKLLDYLEREKLTNMDRYEYIYRASLASNKNKTDLLNYLIKLSPLIEDDLLLLIHRDLLFINIENNTYNNKFNEYQILFDKSDTFTSNDIYAFALCIKYNSDNKNILEALKLCDIIDKKIVLCKDENLKFESVIIYYWYANLYFSLKDKTNAVKYANLTLALIDNSNGRKMSMIDEAGLKSISAQLNQIKLSSSITSPIIVTKKYGRNDRVKVKYNNGDVIEKKYKQVEADILAGRCVVI
jgi:hypothetical protein